MKTKTANKILLESIPLASERAFIARDLDGNLIWWQRCEAEMNFPSIEGSGGWKLATIQIGGEEEKE